MSHPLFLVSLKLGNMLEPLLTRKQVAERLKVCTETVKRWQRQGKIPAVIINSHCVRYEPKAVDKLIAEARTGRAP